MVKKTEEEKISKELYLVSEKTRWGEEVGR